MVEKVKEVLSRAMEETGGEKAKERRRWQKGGSRRVRRQVIAGGSEKVRRVYKR